MKTRLIALAAIFLLATTLHAENKKKVVKQTMRSLSASATQLEGFLKNPPAGITKYELNMYSVLIGLDIGNVETDLNLYYFFNGPREVIDKDLQTLSRDLEDRPEPVQARPEQDTRPTT